MKYKYYSLFIFLLGLSWMVTACSNDIDYTYKGRNYIQISTSDDPALSENDDRAISVDVLLATAVEKDATINFELSDNTDDILRLEGGAVQMKAGEKTASFKVLSNRQSLLNRQRTITLKVKDYTDERMQPWNDLRLTVRPNPTLPELTEQQIELIHGYMEKYGLNLNRFMGEVSCRVEVTFPTDEIGIFSDTETRSFMGKTIITLSENATTDRPILKMIDNPMGLTSFLWEIYRKETVESEFWIYEGSRYISMLEAVDFDVNKEIFSVVLDDLELLPEEKAFSFVRPVLDIWEDEVETVPFEYSFTAWNRWKQMADEGGTIVVQEGDNMVETSVSGLIEEGITLNPINCLVSAYINEDYWENDPSDWIEPKGMYDERTFSFQFPWDHVNSLGYTQIRVTYTLNE